MLTNASIVGAELKVAVIGNKNHYIKTTVIKVTVSCFD